MTTTLDLLRSYEEERQARREAKARKEEQRKAKRNLRAVLAVASIGPDPEAEKRRLWEERKAARRERASQKRQAEKVAAYKADPSAANLAAHAAGLDGGLAASFILTAPKRVIAAPTPGPRPVLVRSPEEVLADNLRKWREERALREARKASR